MSTLPGLSQPISVQPLLSWNSNDPSITASFLSQLKENVFATTTCRSTMVKEKFNQWHLLTQEPELRNEEKCQVTRWPKPNSQRQTRVTGQRFLSKVGGEHTNQNSSTLPEFSQPISVQPLLAWNSSYPSIIARFLQQLKDNVLAICNSQLWVYNGEEEIQLVTSPNPRTGATEMETKCQVIQCPITEFQPAI
jgi:hypothetical protein